MSDAPKVFIDSCEVWCDHRVSDPPEPVEHEPACPVVAWGAGYDAAHAALMAELLEGVEMGRDEEIRRQSHKHCYADECCGVAAFPALDTARAESAALRKRLAEVEGDRDQFRTALESKPSHPRDRVASMATGAVIGLAERLDVPLFGIDVEKEDFDGVTTEQMAHLLAGISASLRDSKDASISPGAPLHDPKTGWRAGTDDCCSDAGEPFATPEEAIDAWLGGDSIDEWRDQSGEHPDSCVDDDCTCIPEHLYLWRTRSPDHTMGHATLILEHLATGIDKPEDCGEDWPPDGMVRMPGPPQRGLQSHRSLYAPGPELERLDQAITTALREYLVAMTGSALAPWWEAVDTQEWVRTGDEWKRDGSDDDTAQEGPGRVQGVVPNPPDEKRVGFRHCIFCGAYDPCDCPEPLEPNPQCPECNGEGSVLIDEVDIGVGIQNHWGPCRCRYPEEQR